MESPTPHTPPERRSLHAQMADIMAPIIAEALAENGGAPTTVVEYGCGQKPMLEHIEPDERLRLIAIDRLAADIDCARRRVRQAVFHAANVEDHPAGTQIADVGIARGVMSFDPAKLLRAMYQTQKPGSSCIVDMRLMPEESVRYCQQTGSTVTQQILTVAREQFSVTHLDHSDSQNAGLKRMGAQTSFHSVADMKRCITCSGFDIVDHTTLAIEREIDRGNGPEIIEQPVEVFHFRKPKIVDESSA